MKTRNLLKKAIFVVCASVLFYGCTTQKPIQTVSPVCRHWAVFGAVTWQNLTGQETAVAIGKTKNNLLHSQAFVVNKEGLVIGWLVYRKGTWILGKQDNFEVMEALDPELAYTRILNSSKF